MNLTEDRHSSTPQTTNLSTNSNKPTLLASMTEAMDLTDLWRLHHPADQEYTHFSDAHNSLSRIDYIFSTPVHCYTPQMSILKICKYQITHHWHWPLTSLPLREMPDYGDLTSKDFKMALNKPGKSMSNITKAPCPIQFVLGRRQSLKRKNSIICCSPWKKHHKTI